MTRTGAGFDLREETVVVTGAAGGIGAGVARVLTEAGARVLLADLPGEGLAATARELDQPWHSVDVTDEDSVRSLAEDAVADLGRITGLVNCAGVLTIAPMVDLPVQDWDRVMAVNARGVFLVSKHIARHMRDNGRGAIVNLSSASGRQGDPGYSHYSASKFAVIGFTQAIAAELAPYGVRANSICPGLVATPMLDGVLAAAGTDLDTLTGRDQLLPQAQSPRDIGEAAAFLLGAPAITGQALNVDGGYRLN